MLELKKSIDKVWTHRCHRSCLLISLCLPLLSILLYFFPLASTFTVAPPQIIFPSCCGFQTFWQQSLRMNAVLVFSLLGYSAQGYIVFSYFEFKHNSSLRNDHGVIAKRHNYLLCADCERHFLFCGVTLLHII